MDIQQRGNYRFCTRLLPDPHAADGAFNALDVTRFDRLLAAYWRAVALPLPHSMTRWRGKLLLHESRLQFHAAPPADVALDVALRFADADVSSMRMQGAVFSGDTVVASGYLVYWFVDADSLEPARVPGGLPVMLEQFEAGACMIKSRAGDWVKLGAAAREVRKAVFVEEQGIAEVDEWDSADLDAVHVVLTNRLGQAVATGRLLQGDEGEAHIGRVAVLRSLREQGFGRLTMEALEGTARSRGVQVLHLSAQRSAEPFYQRLGYVVHGQPYDEVGIPHIAMQKTLAQHQSGI